MTIAILLYDQFTALDGIGPYEVLSRLPGADLSFVAKAPGPVESDTGFLRIVAEPLADLREPDIVVVPGGPGSEAAASDPVILSWLRHAHESSRWTTSVCTGSEVLAAAGLLDGLEATTHWAFADRLEKHGVTPTRQRVVFQGKVVTAAGVSSGIDMALALAAREVNDDFAQALQLGIEYDPQPPFDAGSPEKAPPAVVELVRGTMRSAARSA
jgi:transcriptional regulator GlxA family with amidase domain